MDGRRARAAIRAGRPADLVSAPEPVAPRGFDPRGLFARFVAFGVAGVLVALVLAFRLWDIQIANGTQGRVVVDRSGMATEPIKVERGLIYDQIGRAHV